MQSDEISSAVKRRKSGRKGFFKVVTINVLAAVVGNFQITVEANDE